MRPLEILTSPAAFNSLDQGFWMKPIRRSGANALPLGAVTIYPLPLPAGISHDFPRIPIARNHAEAAWSRAQTADEPVQTGEPTTASTAPGAK